MSQPPRPALKPGDRKDSKVRFSREELAPIRSDPSDFLPSTDPRASIGSTYIDAQEGEYYDNEGSYPFNSEPVELSESVDNPSQHQEYYREYPVEEEPQYIQNHEPLNDTYTAPPRVVGGRRWSNAIHRPTLDTLHSTEEEYHQQQITSSPRNSVIQAQQYREDQPSPYRPPSALRSSLAHRGDSPRSGESPFREARSSAPNIGYTPPRRMLEQHRFSVPNGSPNIVPNGASNRQGGNQDLYSPGNRGTFGERERRYSPVPAYQEEVYAQNDQRRGSIINHQERENTNYVDGKDRLWVESQNQNQISTRYENHRSDSDETLYGVENEKAKYSPNPRNININRQRSLSDSSKMNLNIPKLNQSGNGMRRRTTRQLEEDNDDYDEDDSNSTYSVKGGVFSQLLKLTGRTNTLSMKRRFSSKSGNGGGGGGGLNTSGPGLLPTMKSLGLKRLSSSTSTIVMNEEFDQDDPRVTGQKKKKNHRRNSLSDLPFMRTDTGDSNLTSGKRKRRASIQLHVADILTRQQFVLKLAKALMRFGAPSHRIESQLQATALVLEIDAQFIHFPMIVIASFGDMDTRTSETHFVKVTDGGLELGKLHKVHNIYKNVVHDEMDASEGTKLIHKLMKSPQEYNLWQRMLLAFLCSGLIAPVGFGGSLIDGLASGALGILLSFMQLHVASKSAMYSNIFEISIATVVSFTARGLSTTGIFCYQAVASAGVVLILPGYTILCGSLELASKNIMSGSVRMVYAIIYSLFLGFGITIGSDLFYVFDRNARIASQAATKAAQSYIEIQGSFFSNSDTFNSTAITGLPIPLFNGTFTFSNKSTDQITSNLNQGSIICVRDPNWPWWRQGMPQIYLILFIPIFSVLLSMWNMQPLRSRQLPVMCFICCIGYLTNALANHYIFDRSDVVSALGAFVIGVMGNIYSRVFGGTAFTSMVPGVLFLVPSGIAAAGGLAMTTNPHHSDSYSQGLVIGFRMVQVAIGITVGLFGSGLLIYSFGRKKGAALFAF
ncbi:uncharacterized protein I206_104538 [Kwoniella pini CBS 10737]|uniref:Pheromone-regulated membrane protein 10 n=1 Tax=Kwoniella pini CBS 10737 TaxID=1296096 RepID=A0A1B9I786_9TREE|nr:uncharacterized protein I206_02070 [Kwoniella pini CBS 10737]OCF51356.1 hypothetical protein I206_02070 [Kwoniella pini CBS 10737]